MSANRMMSVVSADPVRGGFSLSDMLSGLAGGRACGRRFLLALLAGSALLVGSFGWRTAVAEAAPVFQRTRPPEVVPVVNRHSASKDSAAKASRLKLAASSTDAAGKRMIKKASARSSARNTGKKVGGGKKEGPAKTASAKKNGKHVPAATKGGKKAVVATRASAGKAVAKAGSTASGKKSVKTAAKASTGTTRQKTSSRAVGKKSVLADESSVRLNRAQRGLARHISRKYRVPQASIERYVGYAHQSGRAYNVDPYLILAVMATESSFNPRAESRVGAQGLMQVHTRVHKDRFKPYGSTKMVWQPKVNIQVGSSILAGYIKRYGSERRALKAYVGAANMSHDFGYGRKVLKRRDEFLSVSVAARNGSGTSQAAAESRRRTRNL